MDDRSDLYKVTNQKVLQNARSVAGVYHSKDIISSTASQTTVATRHFGKEYSLCEKEPFFDQPISAICTAFLVSEDVVVTAGHCLDEDNISNIKFAFGFSMKDEETAVTTFDSSDVFVAKNIISRKYTKTGADWCVVRLSTKVDTQKHPPLKVRRTQALVPNKQAVYVIGHPCGLPLKFADGAQVIQNNDSDYFVANLDTYGGNSGSPVFNQDTHEVEGILVRGVTDFIPKGPCMVSRICPANSDCIGESCTRISLVSTYI